MNSIDVLDRTATIHRHNRRLDRTPIPPDVRREYFDTHLNCTVVATTPAADPVSWLRFMTAARRSYRKHGVESALEFDSVVDGRSTALFFIASNSVGRPVGGFRVQGPYNSPDETHADVEWAGDAVGRAALRAMVTDRLPHGVVEMKSVWTDPDVPRTSVTGYLGAVGATLGAAALGARFTLATSGEHSAAPYVRSGGRIATHIDAVAYPDDRYRTRALWWDRRTLAADADPALYELISTAHAAMFPHTSHEEKALAS